MVLDASVGAVSWSGSVIGTTVVVVAVVVAVAEVVVKLVVEVGNDVRTRGLEAESDPPEHDASAATSATSSPVPTRDMVSTRHVRVVRRRCARGSVSSRNSPSVPSRG